MQARQGGKGTRLRMTFCSLLRVVTFWYMTLKREREGGWREAMAAWTKVGRMGEKGGKRSPEGPLDPSTPIPKIPSFPPVKLGKLWKFYLLCIVTIHPLPLVTATNCQCNITMRLNRNRAIEQTRGQTSFHVKTPSSVGTSLHSKERNLISKASRRREGVSRGGRNDRTDKICPHFAVGSGTL